MSFIEESDMSDDTTTTMTTDTTTTAASSSIGLKYEWQYILIVILVTLSSSLSILGSCLVMKIANRKRRHKKRTENDVYERIVLNLSRTDIFFSLTAILQPWMMNGEKLSNAPNIAKIGNVASCSAIGALFGFGSVSLALQNCILSCYFAWKLRYKWTTIQIEIWECRLRRMALWFPLVLSIAGLWTSSYNPGEFLICTPTEYIPLDCTEDESCIRGQHVAFIAFPTLFLLFVATISGLVATYLVYRSVHTTISEKQLEPKEDEATKTLRRAMGVQALYYALAYFHSFFWFTINRVAIMVGLDTSSPMGYTIMALGYTCFPLQGFLNFWVYIRPSVAKWRLGCPDATIAFVLQKIICTREKPPSAYTSYDIKTNTDSQQKGSGGGPSDEDSSSSLEAISNNNDIDGFAYNPNSKIEQQRQQRQLQFEDDSQSGITIDA